MPKLAWVLVPLVLVALVALMPTLRGHPPRRQTLNAAFSLLLLVYVAITAGLGIFWVASQHLPVFDWHYLFGYGVVALVALHLAFNWRALWRHLRGRARVPAGETTRRPALGVLGLLGFAAVAGSSFLIGLRRGRTELRLGGPRPAAGADEATALALVEQFHALSSHSRTGVWRHAASVHWGDAPPAFKILAGSRVVALAAGPRPPATRSLDAASLGPLLWHVAGVSLVRAGVHLRTAPSSGALFATELYVLALRIPGLDQGLWHYQPRDHSLALLRDGALDAASLGLDRPLNDAAALVIATAVFRRSGRKYGDRAYRYMLADLGHALENLRVAAQALGIGFGLLPRFDESRAAMPLGIDEAEEGVLSLAVLGAGADATQPFAALAPSPGVRQGGVRQGSSWQPPALQDAASAPLGLTDAVHRATSLRRSDATLAAAAPARSGTSGPESSAVALPPPRRIDFDALAVIARRRSVRRFAPTAVAVSDLAAVLAAMAAPPPQLSAAVRIHVLTLAVTGLPAAVWHYDAPAHALVPVADAGAGLRPSARAAALDQDVVGDAAVVFVLSIDRAAFAADAAGAARGYRHAFIEAGMVGERVYLEAGARALAVCAIGAFFDDEAATLVGADPASEWVVHFVALGVPA